LILFPRAKYNSRNFYVEAYSLISGYFKKITNKKRNACSTIVKHAIIRHFTLNKGTLCFVINSVKDIKA